MITKRGARALLVLALWGATVLAGERTSIQGLGMARTNVGVARGLDAVGVNPANVDDADATISFSLFPIGAHVGSDFLTYDLYTRYFTGVDTDHGRVGRSLTNADKEQILNAFPDGVGRIGMDAEVRAFGLGLHTGVGTIAFTVTEKVSASIQMPSEYARFLFYGNTPGSAYDFGQSDLDAWWLREYAVTIARTWKDVLGFESLAGGVSVKVLHGFGYAELLRFNSRLETGTNGVLHGVVDMQNRSAGIDPLTGKYNGPFSPFPAPVGSGMAVDLGVSARINSLLRVGISVTDIGSLDWNRNVRFASAESSLVIDNPMDEAQRDRINDALQGESHAGTSFSTPLPTTVRVGAALNLTELPIVRQIVFGDMIVAGEVAQVLQDGPGALAGTRASLGMEWAPWGFLPLRTGVSWGGMDHSNFALGFGLHFGFFEFDAASENLGWIFSPETFSYGSVSAGMKLNF